jgi:hypothetical protein
MSKDKTQNSSVGQSHDSLPYLAETVFNSSTLTRKHNILSRHFLRCSKRSLKAMKDIFSAKSQDILTDNYCH